MKKVLLLSISFAICYGIMAQCPLGEVEVEIKVNTDNWGYEVYWELVPSGNGCGSGTIFSGGNNVQVGCSGGADQNASPGNGYANNASITEGPWCLIDGASYDIIFVDDFGDGGADFEVFINGFPVYEFVGTGSNSTFTFEALNPLPLDLTVSHISTPSFSNSGEVIIKGTIKNIGTNTISSLDLNYSIDGSTTVTDPVLGLNILPFTKYNFEHSVPWDVADIGEYVLSSWASNLNGGDDMDPTNDKLDKTITIGEPIPNIIDQYITAEPTFTIIGDLSNGVNTPRDLDFHPNLNRKELWIINKGTEATGGSTVTFWNAGENDQTSELKKDGNAWHFMSLPTGIAFSENENFSTTPGVQDANHSGGTFTGPTLWSSDPDIYAQPSGGNGSHLDMVHASPYAMGIAHEIANVFWVYDGWNGNICRYDFVDDHGPGNDYHADAIVRRYTEVTVQMDGNHIVNGMVLDKESGWLYSVDNGNDRVIRLDINSGSVSGNLPLINEPLAEYSNMTGVNWEEYITTGLIEPSGIAHIEDRLLVSDHFNGDIIIYDISGPTALEIHRIQTGSPGIMGITIGPLGRIWYVNATDNQVVKIEGDQISSIDDLIPDNPFTIYPNPTDRMVIIQFPQHLSAQRNVTICSIDGKILSSHYAHSGENQIQIDLSKHTPGLYFVNVEIDGIRYSKKVILEK